MKTKNRRRTKKTNKQYSFYKKYSKKRSRKNSRKQNSRKQNILSGGDGNNNNTIPELFEPSKKKENPLIFTTESLFNDEFTDFLEKHGEKNDKNDTGLYIMDNQRNVFIEFSRIYKGWKIANDNDNRIYAYNPKGFIPFPGTYVVLIYNIHANNNNVIESFSVDYDFINNDFLVQNENNNYQLAEKEDFKVQNNNNNFPPDLIIELPDKVKTRNNNNEKNNIENTKKIIRVICREKLGVGNEVLKIKKSDNRYQYAYFIFRRINKDKDGGDEDGVYESLMKIKNDDTWKWEWAPKPDKSRDYETLKNN